MAEPSLQQFVQHGKKIVGIGLNYKCMAESLKMELPAEPVVFLKPTTAYVTAPQPIKIPATWTSIYHEVELGVLISRRGFEIPEEDAVGYVGGYCLALDMTNFELVHKEVRPKGLPWDIVKGFDTSCPVSEFIDLQRIADPHNVELWCTVNGEKRQDGNTANMVFRIPQLIHYVSQFMTLEAGDLILTGTPKGTGPVKRGDVIECGLRGIIDMKFPVK